MHVAIKAATESEVRAQRRDIRVRSVVDLDSDNVVRADGDVGGCVKCESPETALVLAQEVAIEIHVCDIKRAVELEEKMTACIAAVHSVVAAIPADAAVIIVAAVLAIEIVPGVRQDDLRPGRIVEIGVL